MDTFVVQDWLTLSGFNASTITQPENSWLDLIGYQDAVAWLHVVSQGLNGFTGQMTYQTSPVAEDALFADMANLNLVTSNNVTGGIFITPMLKDAMPTGAPPLARWFRWQLSQLATGFSFRLIVSANRIGRRTQTETIDMKQPFMLAPLMPRYVHL
jgi:hypothetical protein